MVKIEIQGGTLDIVKDIPISLNYSIKDIIDPSKRTSNFSKSILLAGTKNNNKHLGSLYDIAADFSIINPNFKIPAKLTVDGLSVIDGFLQLKKVRKVQNSYPDGDEIEYIATINSNTVDIFSEVGDKLLTDLDLSVYDHIFSQQVISNSWNNTYLDGYTYPLLWNGSNDYNLATDFRTCVFYRTYIEAIFREAGYSLGGSFLNNEIWNREIIPFNGDMKITPIEIFRRKFEVGTYLNNVINTYTYLDEQLDSTLLPIDYLTDETSTPFFDDNNHWDGTTWTVDRTGNYNITLNLNFELNWNTNFTIDGFAVSGANTLVTVNNHRFPNGMTLEIYNTVNYNGTYVISNVTSNTFIINTVYVSNELSGKIRIDATQHSHKIDSNGNVYDNVVNNPPKHKIYTYMYINGIPVQSMLYQIQDPGLINYNNFYLPYSGDTGTGTTLNMPGLLFYSGNSWSQSKLETIYIFLNNISLNTNDLVTFKHKVVRSSTESQYNSWRDVNDINVPANFTWKIANIPFNGHVSELKVNPSGSIGNDDAIEISNVTPIQVKQKDLIKDLFTRFNVVLHVDPNNEKKILLDTRDDYYDAGSVVDWTDKKDYDKEDVITFISDLHNKEVLFTYKKGKDTLNVEHTDSNNGDIYGQKKITYNNEFIKGVKTLQSIFSPTINTDGDLLHNKIVPFIDVTLPSGGDKTNIRVLQYGGLKTTLNNTGWNLTWIDNSTSVPTTQITTYTQYPYAGYTEDPFNGTTSNLFGIPAAKYYHYNNEVNGNLYNKYWSNYINEVATGKLVTSYLYLKPIDINYIKNSMNSKIFIKDQYYNISEIYDYDPTISKTVKVDLIKIVPNLNFVQKSIPTQQVPIKVTKPIITSVGTSTNNTLSAKNLLVNGNNNTVRQQSNNSMIIGSNNYIGSNSINVGIIGGSNNYISPGVNNSYVISSNNRVINYSNEIWLGNLHIINGSIISSVDVIDGGLNIVRPLNATDPTTIVDGGLNVVRPLNVSSPITIIDGGII